MIYCIIAQHRSQPFPSPIFSFAQATCCSLAPSPAASPKHFELSNICIRAGKQREGWGRSVTPGCQLLLHPPPPSQLVCTPSTGLSPTPAMSHSSYLTSSAHPDPHLSPTFLRALVASRQPWEVSLSEALSRAQAVDQTSSQQMNLLQQSNRASSESPLPSLV